MSNSSMQYKASAAQAAAVSATGGRPARGRPDAGAGRIL